MTDLRFDLSLLGQLMLELSHLLRDLAARGRKFVVKFVRQVISPLGLSLLQSPADYGCVVHRHEMRDHLAGHGTGRGDRGMSLCLKPLQRLAFRSVGLVGVCPGRHERREQSRRVRRPLRLPAVVVECGDVPAGQEVHFDAELLGGRHRSLRGVFGRRDFSAASNQLDQLRGGYQANAIRFPADTGRIRVRCSSR